MNDLAHRLGLLHLVRGAPTFSEGADALADSGGYLGAAIGAPVFALVRDKKAPMTVTSTPFVPNRYYRG